MTHEQWVRDVADPWCQFLRTELRRSARTVDQYGRALRRLDQMLRAAGVEDGLSAAPEPLAAALEPWRRGWLDRLREGQCTTDAIRGVFAPVRAYARWMMEERGVWDRDPTQRLRTPRGPRRLPRPVLPEVVEQLLAACDRTTWDGRRDYLLLVAWYHGLRNIETVRLQTTDVQLGEDGDVLVLHVLGKGAVQGSQEPALLRHEPSVALADYILETHAGLAAARVLEEIEAQYPLLPPVQQRLRAATEWVAARGPQPLFRKHRQNPDGVTERFNHARFMLVRDRAGVGSAVTPHRLRHTCATQLLEAGMDLRDVQEALRHKDVRSTTLYTEVTQSRRRRTIDALPTVWAVGEPVHDG